MAIQGSVTIHTSDDDTVEHTYGSEGDFWTDDAVDIHDWIALFGDADCDLPLNVGKIIALEDSYGSIDEDYDDFFWTLDISSLSPDLDIDSDNNNGVSNPDRSDAEDRIESSTAKEVVANTGDTNGNLVVDFADFAAQASNTFVPVKLDLSTLLSLDEASVDGITFNYDGSDPSNLASTGSGALGDPTIHTANSGSLRLWVKGSNETRSVGDYLIPGVAYPLETLGTDQNNVATLYLESVRGTETSQDISVEVEFSSTEIDGTLGDTVSVETKKRNKAANFALNAFIPNTLGDPSGSNQLASTFDNVGWQVEPGPVNPGWYRLSDFPISYQGSGPQPATVFATDNRGSAAQSGTYRLATELKTGIYPGQVGNLTGRRLTTSARSSVHHTKRPCTTNG